MKLWCPNNYFSCDLPFVILAWVQSWNVFEKLMKLWSPSEFFHKNMPHEQLPFMWSTFGDSRMGTMLKYFWKTHESVQSAWILSEKHSHEQLLLTWSTFRDSSVGTKLKIFEKLMKVCSPPEFFHNADHTKGNCSWDMILWKKSGGLHSFMSCSKVFQLCTHASSTKCGSRQK